MSVCIDDRKDIGVYFWMHALWLVILLARNKGVSITKIGFVKPRLPKISLEKILAFGEQDKLRNQTLCYREEPGK